MHVQHHEEEFIARDGRRLHGQCWLPLSRTRAAIAVVHGFTEHGGRYAWTAEELTAWGYAVHTVDLRGHGRSEGRRCYVWSLDEYLNDVDVLVHHARQHAPRQPLFLFGHSLGGLLAAQWCILRQPDLAGLVLSSPALQLQYELFPLAKPLASVAGSLCPWLPVMRMGSANVSRDPEVVAQFEADPLVFHDRVPMRTLSEVLRGMRRISRQLDDLRAPLLILHGTADRVCATVGSRDLCRHAGSDDKTLYLYEGFYHEVLSDPERAQAMAHLLTWLDRRCGPISEQCC
jgi:alpha-beta hydrolase superfamily lysophospholipase